jgi:hypothetical protein
MLIASSLRKNAAAGIVALTLMVASPARAEEATTMAESMLGLASAVCTMVYTPIKVGYAAGGLGVGTLVWLFSAGNTDSMNSVLKTTAGGDYVVTAEHLRGIKVLRFAGRSKRS